MAISKSTPYVRYKKDFTSSLHLGTIHIESEYLDRTQKTTIESIHGMTWHNKVVNENKELNLLSDTQLELTELEKQYWNTGEKRVSVDEIHTLEEVEPNEDGTYTYTVNSMEGEYIEIYDGINNITSTSDGLDGQFEIVYDTTEEDVSGNIALDQVVPQYEIIDSGVGAITGAKSTGLTLINHITEPSKEEVVAIQEYEGQYFTIENTVQGNIKSAILKGQTLVNLAGWNNIKTLDFGSISNNVATINFEHYYAIMTIKTENMIKQNTTYTFIIDSKVTKSEVDAHDNPPRQNGVIIGFTDGTFQTPMTSFQNVGERMLQKIVFTIENKEIQRTQIRLFTASLETSGACQGEVYSVMLIEGDYTNTDIPYFEGMQSVKMPVLTTVGKNLFNKEGLVLQNKKQVRADNGEFVYSTASSGFDNYFDCQFLQGKTINVSSIATGTGGEIAFYTIDKTYIKGGNLANSYLIPENAFYYRFSINILNTSIDEANIQVEVNSVATTYQPHKSTTVTVNENIELNSIGDIYDELNVTTGRLTQRIGEYQITGEEDWRFESNNRRLQIDNPTFIPNLAYSEFVCDKLQVKHTNDDSLHVTVGTYYIGYTSDNWLRIILGEDITSLEQGKEWLRANKPTIQYQLATESVKTVDLTVQNQDGGTIPHIQTQQGITHVSTSSDGLTPVVEMSCSYDTIIKPNTTYTIKLDRPIVSDTMYLQVDLGGTMMMLDADVNAFTIKTPSTLSHSQLRLSGVGNTVKEIIVLEGSRVNDKIEYFEGMKNVENPILVVSNCPYVFGKGGRL